MSASRKSKWTSLRDSLRALCRFVYNFIRYRKREVEPPGVVIKTVDHSEFDPTAPMSLSVPPTGPIMVNSPEELDDLTGEPRGTTREMLRATGARRITAIGRIKVPGGLANEPEGF